MGYRPKGKGPPGIRSRAAIEAWLTLQGWRPHYSYTTSKRTFLARGREVIAFARLRVEGAITFHHTFTDGVFVDSLIEVAWHELSIFTLYQIFRYVYDREQD